MEKKTASRLRSICYDDYDDDDDDDLNDIYIWCHVLLFCMPSYSFWKIDSIWPSCKILITSKRLELHSKLTNKF